MDSEEMEHKVDLIVMQPSEKSIGSSEDYYIIQEESKEEPITKVPHIDFIFKDQQWIFEDRDLWVQRPQLKHLMVKSYSQAKYRHQKKQHFRSTFT